MAGPAYLNRPSGQPLFMEWLQNFQHLQANEVELNEQVYHVRNELPPVPVNKKCFLFADGEQRTADVFAAKDLLMRLVDLKLLMPAEMDLITKNRVLGSSLKQLAMNNLGSYEALKKRRQRSERRLLNHLNKATGDFSIKNKINLGRVTLRQALTYLLENQN